MTTIKTNLVILSSAIVLFLGACENNGSNSIARWNFKNIKSNL
jgi:hypothetical protein